jgi:hypothetical protein
VEEDQYDSLRIALRNTLQRQGWVVKQNSFIAGARSLNEQDLRNNLTFFKVPEASFESIRMKLAMRIFDEYSNFLRCMNSIRFNGCTTRSGTSTEAQSTSSVATPPLVNILEAWRPGGNKFKKRGEGNKEERDT